MHSQSNSDYSWYNNFLENWQKAAGPCQIPDGSRGCMGQDPVIFDRNEVWYSQFLVELILIMELDPVYRLPAVFKDWDMAYCHCHRSRHSQDWPRILRGPGWIWVWTNSSWLYIHWRAYFRTNALQYVPSVPTPFFLVVNTKFTFYTAYDHPQGPGRVIQRNCRVLFDIYIPVNWARFPFVLLVARGNHSHHPPFPNKLPRTIADEVYRALNVNKILAASPRKYRIKFMLWS
jgi:hypothetical protein